MATVYRAEDTGLQRIVALKVLPPEFLHDETFETRFQREARVVAKLEHPHIVPIYASGIDDGVPWMSMRLFAGGNIGMLLERRRLHAKEAMRVLRSVAEALDYAHARGVVHRDIKPANILLDETGHVCLSDFGVAQLLQAERGVTRTGTLVGTPHYMAPEQALGESVDHRCDIYSLGIVAYEMFVGVPPFTGDSPMAVLLKQINQPVPVPSDPRLPPAVMTAIQKAVTKGAGDRWTSAGAFVSALESAAGGLHGHLLPGERKDRVAVASSSPRWLTPAVAGAALASVLVLWTMRDFDAQVDTPEPLVSESPVAEPLSLPSPTGTSTPTQPEPPDRSAPASREPTAEVRMTEDSKKPVSSPSRPPADIPTARPPVPLPLPSAPASSPSMAATDNTTSSESASPPQNPAADVVTPPVRLRAPNPQYPAAARAAQIEGDVVLEAVVGADGHVHDVTVSKSVHPLIDEAAKNAVLRYEYTPGRRNGIPEPARIRVVVSFKLQ